MALQLRIGLNPSGGLGLVFLIVLILLLLRLI
jgi:hypothetical protein